MFKLQSKYKSMDINKNLEKYKFFPKQKNQTNYQKSFSYNFFIQFSCNFEPFRATGIFIFCCVGE